MFKSRLVFCGRVSMQRFLVFPVLTVTHSRQNNQYPVIVRMKIPFYTIDAFTSEPFSGNPAAVCPLEDDLSDDLKQSIATEMNISETCYITKEQNESFQSGQCFGLRWFTPTNEVPLCGHATLAAATVLFRVGLGSKI